MRQRSQVQILPALPNTRYEMIECRKCGSAVTFLDARYCWKCGELLRDSNVSPFLLSTKVCASPIPEQELAAKNDFGYPGSGGVYAKEMDAVCAKYRYPNTWPELKESNH